MTDLPKRLEAAGRREANNALNEQIYERGGIPPDDEIAPPENYRYHNGFTDCHRSLHPLIQKMAEALEEIGSKEWVQGSSVKMICTNVIERLKASGNYKEGK